MGVFTFGNSTHIFAHTEQIPKSYVISFGPTGTSALYGLFHLMSFLSCSALILTILFSTEVKKKGLNLYLIFILLPEVFVSSFGFVELVITHLSRVYPYSDNLCILSSIVCNMYTYTNLWTNALCANELYFVLLIARERRGRLETFSSKRILYKILIVYLASCAMTTWYMWDINLTNTRIDPFFCLPVPHTEVGKIINEDILPVFNVLLPPIYVLYVTCQVHQKKLLPREMNDRYLATYFLRVACTMSFYSLLVVLSLERFSLEVVDLTLLLLSPHGLILSTLTIQKRDIRRAVLKGLDIRQNEVQSTAAMTMSNESSVVRE